MSFVSLEGCCNNKKRLHPELSEVCKALNGHIAGHFSDVLLPSIDRSHLHVHVHLRCLKLFPRSAYRPIYMLIHVYCLYIIFISEIYVSEELLVGERKRTNLTS